MNSKTEELLRLMLWSADRLMRPSFRNLTDSYECWAYGNGFSRQLDRLEQSHLLEQTRKVSGSRLYRLTEEGRIHALGGRDPVACWSRPWDGIWHLIVFDVPITLNKQRSRLRRYLKSHRFGVLQGSVWISPDPLRNERSVLEGGEINVKSPILLDARPCSGESDEEIVAAAWDFEAINRRYTEYLTLLDECPAGNLRTERAATNFARWAQREREAWDRAMDIDPLLPQCLLPKKYLGHRAWQRRVEVFRTAQRTIQTYCAPTEIDNSAAQVHR